MAKSEESFRRALALNAHDSVTYGDFALSLLFPLDRIDEAVYQLRAAVKDDPVAPRPRFILANALIAAGRFEEAARICANLPADFPGKGDWLGRIRLGQGRVQEAIQILEEAGGQTASLDSETRGFLGYVYGRAGRRDDAERLASQTSDPYNQALTFAGEGDKERTILALTRMAPLGPVRLGRDLNYPEFAFVHNDVRVKALRQMAGLPGETGK